MIASIIFGDSSNLSVSDASEEFIVNITVLTLNFPNFTQSFSLLDFIFCLLAAIVVAFNLES